MKPMRRPRPTLKTPPLFGVVFGVFPGGTGRMVSVVVVLVM